MARLHMDAAMGDPGYGQRSPNMLNPYQPTDIRQPHRFNAEFAAKGFVVIIALMLGAGVIFGLLRLLLPSVRLASPPYFDSLFLLELAYPIPVLAIWLFDQRPRELWIAGWIFFVVALSTVWQTDVRLGFASAIAYALIATSIALATIAFLGIGSRKQGVPGEPIDARESPS